MASLQDEASATQEQNETTLALALFRQEARASLVDEFQRTFGNLGEEETDDEPVERNATWQKVVEHKTPPTLPAIVSAPPRPQTGTFHSILPGFPRKTVPPRLFFWLSLLALLALLLGGTFGVALGFGRENQPVHSHVPILQLSPATIALGGILTLRGTQFTSSGRIALKHDQHVPLYDTGGVDNILADAHGAFSDTVIINPRWQAGRHALYAIDTRTQKEAIAWITVTGQSALQGPPHLLLSSYNVNMGEGDEATNSNELLAVSNAGGSQLSWEASVDQSWLHITPKDGSIAGGDTMSAVLAAERMHLQPGNYTATVVITSNTEQITLKVSLKVIPLQPKHQAVLQLSPAALTFTGTTGSPDPESQTITVNNPGVRTLTWGASVGLENGANWLRISPSSGEVSPGASSTITVSTALLNLAPGTYKGEIHFTNKGKEAAQGTPQDIYVSLTVAPLCTLALSPANFSFTATAGQGSPAAQSLNVRVASGCTTSQPWSSTVSTTSGGKWLVTSASNGSTPGQVKISVAMTGLAAGSYTGAITFTSKMGQQIVPVSLTIRPVPCGIMGPSTLALQGTAGQSSSVSQNATLSTTGSCPHTLNWSTTAAVGTPSGGNWLSATSGGTLLAPAVATVGIQASLTGLSAGSYSGTVTITALDATTGLSAGKVQLTVTLTVLAAPCALSTPSMAVLTFSANQGSNPTTPAQSFTLNVSGGCSGSVTITATVDAGSSGWLAISPTPVSVSSSGQATFTATITSSALASGAYNATITLSASDGGSSVVGSPQTVSVSLSIA